MARRKLGFWRRFTAATVKPLIGMLTVRTWRGTENIPATGPAILVANHLSHADPFVLGHYVYDAGRWPRFLAKASVFKIPVLGRILAAVQQIPVDRGTVDAVRALDAAIQAVRSGKAVLIYPEGSTTKEPQLWPMRGKTGVARLWLATDAPVIPIVMWGPQQLFDPRTHKLRLLPRATVTVIAGPPLDLSPWKDSAPTTQTLHAITEFIMLRLRDMLVDIRGGTPPPLWTAATTARPSAEPGTGVRLITEPTPPEG